MLTTLFLTSLAVAALIVLVTLGWAWTRGRDDFSHVSSDLAQRLAVVLFGVSFGLVGFYEQKWLENTNAELHLASEAMGNLDIIQGSYLSGLEPVYFNNDTRFVQMYDMCYDDLKAAGDIEAYCALSRPATTAIRFDDLATFTKYFDEPIDETVLDHFQDRFYELTYVKQHAKPDVMEDVFFQLAYVRGWAASAHNEYLVARKRGDDFAMKGFSAADMDDAGKQTDIRRYQHDMCCSIWSLSDDSTKIAAIGTAQAKNFCELRREIGADAEQRADSLTHYLEKDILADIESKAAYYADPKHPARCAFDPEPLDPPDPPHKAHPPIAFGGSEASEP